MIIKGVVHVGDVILHKNKNTIKEWVVNTISPSEVYIEIENDDSFSRWICYSDILEIMESESGIIPNTADEVIVAPKKPIVKATTADFLKSEV